MPRRAAILGADGQPVPATFDVSALIGTVGSATVARAKALGIGTKPASTANAHPSPPRSQPSPLWPMNSSPSGPSTPSATGGPSASGSTTAVDVVTESTGLGGVCQCGPSKTETKARQPANGVHS